MLGVYSKIIIRFEHLCETQTIEKSFVWNDGGRIKSQAKTWMRLLYASEMYRVPFLSTASPFGPLNCTGPFP